RAPCARARGACATSNNDTHRRGSRRRSSPPDINTWRAGEIALRAHDAEALAGRRLHDPPSFHFADALRAEAFQARRLRVDVVRLDVEVKATLVRDALHFDVKV